ncbi:TPA: hypothetical protein PXN50_001873 [Yersinia enterocolitica]|nr:hypothetical protein [Yersinia enterocolitica]
MMMNKLCFFLIASILLSGCAEPPLSQKRDFLIKMAPSIYNPMGASIPVDINTVRGEMVANGWETDDFLKRLSDKCYDLSYAASGSCALDFYYDELKEKKEEKEDVLCSKNSACIKDRETKSAIHDLNHIYYLVMARNQYDQAEFDLTIRQLCKAAGVGQRRGIPLRQIEDDVNQQPGLSPEIRGQLRDVSVSCWVLSKNGVLDGATEIKNIY